MGEAKPGGTLYRVCPGDRIVTGAVGEFYPIKPHAFTATYVLAIMEGE